MGYRRAAVRTHPDKHPPHLRDAAEANFKRLTASHKILLRVGRAIREEAESGDYAGAGAEKRSKLDAEKEEEARRVARLATVFSLNGLSGGFRRVRIHTGPHTAALAWWTPILKDFSRRISPPRVPRFQSRHASTPFNST
jgi:curved DNA-binding protein CbpA